jgi:hypothetical protein
MLVIKESNEDCKNMELLDLIPIDELTPAGRLKRIRDELLQSIKANKEQRLFGSALILLYAGIDIMASLTRPQNAKEVKNCDFKRWACEYLLPNSNLNCTEIDLYAARCGLLHSWSYDSRLSASGKARWIRYIFEDVDAVRRIMGKHEEQDTSIVVVKFDDLLEAFEKGTRKFLKSIENHPQNNTIIIERINSELIFFPLLITV